MSRKPTSIYPRLDNPYIPRYRNPYITHEEDMVRRAIKGEIRIGEHQPFVKDEHRDWEICYESLNKQYIVKDNKTSNCLAIPEPMVREGLDDDQSFCNLIQYIDSYLCTNKGVSKIKLPVVKKRVRLAETPNGIGKHRPLYDSMPIMEKKEQDRPTMKGMSKPPPKNAPKPKIDDYAILTGLQRCFQKTPLRREEVETIDEWKSRVSFHRKPLHIEIGAFEYALGAWITFYSDDGGFSPFFIRKLKKLKQHFLDNLEDTGYQGSVVKDCGNWFAGQTMRFYFRNTKKAEEAIVWFVEKLGYRFRGYSGGK